MAGKRPETLALKRIQHTEREKTRVALGDQFARWRNLKSELKLQTDAKVAEFLLDR